MFLRRIVFTYIHTWSTPLEAVYGQRDFRHEKVGRKEKEKLHCSEKHHAVASGYQNLNTFRQIVVFKFHQNHDKFSIDSVNKAAIFITLQLCFRLLLVKTLGKLKAEEENTEEFNRRHDNFNSTWWISHAFISITSFKATYICISFASILSISTLPFVFSLTCKLLIIYSAK